MLGLYFEIEFGLVYSDGANSFILIDMMSIVDVEFKCLPEVCTLATRQSQSRSESKCRLEVCHIGLSSISCCPFLLCLKLNDHDHA